MIQLLNSRQFLWTLLALPAVILLLSPALPIEKLDPSGEWSAHFLILALAAGPLMLVSAGAPWASWLCDRRTDFALAALAYALLHLTYYFFDMRTLPAILREAGIVSILAGWGAFAALAFLAVAARRQGSSLLRAGRTVWRHVAYPAAFLLFIHWVLVGNGWTAALFHFVPLAILEAYRLFYPHGESAPNA